MSLNVMLAVFGMIAGALPTLVAVIFRRSTGENRRSMQDESERLAEQRIQEIFATNERLLRTVAELDVAYREVEARRVALERSSAAKSLFLANMSHELRTPLNAIIGFSEIIGKEMFGALHNARYRDYIHDIQNAASHAQSLINDLLDLSKIEANKYVVHPEWVDLTEALAEPLRMVRVRTVESPVSLDEDFDTVGPQLFVDRRALKQMVLNLLSNAIKSTAKGKIVLRTRLLPTGEVEVTVEDTGCGIPPEHVDRMLLPFEQIDGSAAGGTGLGLPLVNALVQLHGGMLDIASETGKGTRMTLRFPAAHVSLTQQPLAAMEMCA